MAQYECVIIGGGKEIDIAKYVEEISWESNDLDAPKSGRDLSGVMHRGKVGEKRKLNIKLIPISASNLIPIMSVVRNEYISVRTNMIPVEDESTFEGYNSGRKGGVMVMTTDGVIRHNGVSFNIIER